MAPSVLNPPKSVVSPIAPPRQNQEPELREIGDSTALRTSLYDNVLNAARTMQPMSNKRHTLRLSNVNFADKGDFTFKQQKDAILGGKSLQRRIRGTWNLVDNATGETLDQKEATVAHVPYLTNRGTMIHGGNEYTLSNQMRLRSGIYTRIKDNGEIEAHANILPGKGVAHRYFLDPEKGIFKIKMGQANIPLMPMLRALGVRDKQLREAWGQELFYANAQKDNPADLNKIYKKLVRQGDPNAEAVTKQAAIAEAINAMEMDPEVNGRTLGQRYDRLGLDSILATTKKLLAVSRGEQDVDDRDHLAFQTIHGPEDLFSERLMKDYGGLRRNLLHRASFSGSLKHIGPGALTKQLEAAILSSGLGQPLEEINPADIFDKQSRISRLGEGGIPSVDTVPDEARSVQPSHLAFMDPVRTPESFKVGVDVYVANQVRKGKDGRIYAPFQDPKTGKTIYKTPQELSDLTVAFPREMQRKSKRVAAMKGGKLGYFPRNKVDLVVPHMEHAFSPLGSMIPMKSAVKAQRMAMASRMLTQALPLNDPESPLVQTGMPGEGDTSYEQHYGKQMGAVTSDKAGRVMSITPDGIKVRYDDGTTETKELYNHFPYNRKTYIHNTPTVKPGDMFPAGSVLARSNYTDNAGATALGKNARVAYLPFRGLNFEDAIVVSESMAKRMSSEHMYQNSIDVTDEHKTKRSDFVALFPGKYDRKTLATLDNDGVIHEGATVNFDDPLILAAKQRELGKHKVHRKREAAYGDATVKWNHHSPGIVTDVFKGPKGTTVLVKASSPMQVGDKMSGRYGDKGVIADIIPDAEMPHADGKPYEVLLNPLGIISRTNPAQMVEAILGKIAAKTGKKYNVKDFEDIDDLVEFAANEAKKHGVKDLDMVTDPETDRGIPDVFSGNRFFMKLHHTAESKGAGRGTGGYTSEGAPAKGGETGSKLVSLMDNNALLSHGATEVARDAGAIRGQRNEDFWLPFLQGQNPPPPRVPMMYEKFVNQLRSAGINVIQDGYQTHIMALTSKDIDKMAGKRFLKSGETVKFEKGLEPIKGGLFDEKLTGGHQGNRWSAVKLTEPMPNPVMEEPIRRILGLTGKQFEAVLSGKEPLKECGTGPAAIVKCLEKINLDKELDQARAQISSGKKSLRDQAVRKLGYLKSAKRLGIHPKEWVLDQVPVLPPKFRPVTTMGEKKQPLVSDANFLYKELIEANDNLSEMKGLVDDTGEERLALYSSFKAVTGLGEPIHPKLKEKRVRGVLQHVFGSSPKYGTIQRRLLSSTVDLVGRAVITPNPDLDMDHVGLPESRAWDVYRQFVVRRLKRRGMPLVQAMEQVEKRSSLAREEMLKEMSERPVIINRAPVLHRFGMMAFYPKLVKGDTLQISPLVVGGFNADFDGDAMQYHAPVDNQARDEAAEKMLPSRNLLSPADFKRPMHKPTQEYTGGLYAASTQKTKVPPKRFRNKADVIAAYRRGELRVGDPVEILS